VNSYLQSSHTPKAVLCPGPWSSRGYFHESAHVHESHARFPGYARAIWNAAARPRLYPRYMWHDPLLPSPQPIPLSSAGCVASPDDEDDTYPYNHFAGSVGLVSRFGQFYKSVDPGLVQVNICTESLRIVDVKIQIIPIGRQGVMCDILPLHSFAQLTPAQEPGTTSTSKCGHLLPSPGKIQTNAVSQRLCHLLPN
jgi:hypothetical protein